jgi:choline dehydrogenase
MLFSMQDYIIIGAGSAGCALAHRLSEDPQCQVLLIEAGGKDRKQEISIPAAFNKLFKTRYDWNYRTVAQPYAGFREMYLPRGRVLGGSSSINAMIYIRGNALDYDQWAADGNPGWDYASVLPYFMRAEQQQRGADAFHGEEGPLTVSDLQDPFPISQSFVEAGVELGYGRNSDFNGAQQEGFGLYQVTQRAGKRCSAAKAYLAPIMDRPNLTVMTDTSVLRILLEKDRAVGVECQLKTHVQEFRAREEVILAAGAYNSPHLLMRSGIGPVAEIEGAGLTVKHALPGVGQNLQDHLIVPMVFHNRDRHTLEEAERLQHLVNYLVWGEGPLSSNVAEGGGFVRSQPDLPAPDLQFHFAPGYFLNHGFSRPQQGHGFSVGPTLLQPGSIGSVRLDRKQPHGAPLIDHQYLSAEEDVQTLMRGMRIGYQLLRTKALGRFFKDYYLPSHKLLREGDLERHIRNTAQTLYHPVGTCKMGTDDLAVVDADLRVHGLSGLRVVDASVMPRIIRGNTNATSIMIGEKAADLIKAQAALPTEKDRLAVSSK